MKDKNGEVLQADGGPYSVASQRIESRWQRVPCGIVRGKVGVQATRWIKRGRARVVPVVGCEGSHMFHSGGELDRKNAT